MHTFCISDSTEFGHIFSTFSDGYGSRCYRENDARNVVNTHEMRDEIDGLPSLYARELTQWQTKQRMDVTQGDYGHRGARTQLGHVGKRHTGRNTQ